MRDRAYTFCARHDNGQLWVFEVRSLSATLAWLRAVIYLAENLGVQFHELRLEKEE